MLKAAPVRHSYLSAFSLGSSGDLDGGLCDYEDADADTEPEGAGRAGHRGSSSGGTHSLVLRGEDFSTPAPVSAAPAPAPAPTASSKEQRKTLPAIAPSSADTSSSLASVSTTVYCKSQSADHDRHHSSDQKKHHQQQQQQPTSMQAAAFATALSAQTSAAQSPSPATTSGQSAASAHPSRHAKHPSLSKGLYSWVSEDFAKDLPAPSSANPRGPTTLPTLATSTAADPRIDSPAHQHSGAALAPVPDAAPFSPSLPHMQALEPPFPIAAVPSPPASPTLARQPLHPQGQRIPQFEREDPLNTSSTSTSSSSAFNLSFLSSSFSYLERLRHQASTSLASPTALGPGSDSFDAALDADDPEHESTPLPPPASHPEETLVAKIRRYTVGATGKRPASTAASATSSAASSKQSSAADVFDTGKVLAFEQAPPDQPDSAAGRHPSHGVAKPGFLTGVKGFFSGRLLLGKKSSKSELFVAESAEDIENDYRVDGLGPGSPTLSLMKFDLSQESRMRREGVAEDMEHLRQLQMDSFLTPLVALNWIALHAPVPIVYSSWDKDMLFPLYEVGTIIDGSGEQVPVLLDTKEQCEKLLWMIQRHLVDTYGVNECVQKLSQYAAFKKQSLLLMS